MNKRGRPFGTFKGAKPTSVRGKQTRLYRKWQSMLARCYQPSHQAYKHYHGKGIEVCERWRGPGGFQNFAADMGECPEGLTLERIDNAKGYDPSNCKWATWAEQAANRERNGKPIDPACLRQRAIAAGLPYIQVYLRIHRLHWSEDKALSTPVGQRGL